MLPACGLANKKLFLGGLEPLKFCARKLSENNEIASQNGCIIMMQSLTPAEKKKTCLAGYEGHLQQIGYAWQNDMIFSRTKER